MSGNQTGTTAKTKAVAPARPTELSEMYKRWVLDCVIDVAYAVSKDFTQRVELYQHVQMETYNLLIYMLFLMIYQKFLHFA